MPNRRLSLRKIKEILRLKLECGISEREISRSCQVSRSTIADYLRRAAAAKLTWTEVLALPPLRPPKRPKATAAGFLPSVDKGLGCSGSGICPVASWTTRKALTAKS